RFDQVEVYENLRVMPHLWFAKDTQMQTNEEILKTIRTGLYDPAKATLIERGTMKWDFYPPFSADSSFWGAANATDVLKPEEREPKAEIKHYDPQRIEIDAKTPPIGGFLVLSEIYYDGWEARVDGQPTKIYRTDYTLRGVVVCAGN